MKTFKYVVAALLLVTGLSMKAWKEDGEENNYLKFANGTDKPITVATWLGHIDDKNRKEETKIINPGNSQVLSFFNVHDVSRNDLGLSIQYGTGRGCKPFVLTIPDLKQLLSLTRTVLVQAYSFEDTRKKDIFLTPSFRGYESAGSCSEWTAK